MAIKIFEIKVKTGWKKLDDLLEKIQNAINERTPLSSDTIELDEQPDGLQICVKSSPIGSSEESGGSSGGGGGTPINVYGAKDGNPVIFHLLESSGPTPAPP